MIDQSHIQKLQIIPSINQILLHDQVRSGFEWMTVTIAGRPRPTDAPNKQNQMGLILSITSSFGVYGYEWPNAGGAPHSDPNLTAVHFLRDMSRDSFLSNVLQHDLPEPDFDSSLEAFRQAASELLEDLSPNSARAQEIREAVLQVEDHINSIDSEYADAHKIDLLLSCPAISTVVPEAWDLVPKTGPSFRRRQAEAFYDQLWQPYLALLVKKTSSSIRDHANASPTAL